MIKLMFELTDTHPLRRDYKQNTQLRSTHFTLITSYIFTTYTPKRQDVQSVSDLFVAPPIMMARVIKHRKYHSHSRFLVIFFLTHNTHIVDSSGHPPRDGKDRQRTGVGLHRKAANLNDKGQCRLLPVHYFYVVLEKHYTQSAIFKAINRKQVKQVCKV